MCRPSHRSIGLALFAIVVALGTSCATDEVGHTDAEPCSEATTDCDTTAPPGGETSHVFMTSTGERITFSCAEDQMDIYMYALSLGKGAPTAVEASERILAGSPVSIDTSRFSYEERGTGIVARNSDGGVVAWVSPAQLRDGTWGVGESVNCR